MNQRHVLKNGKEVSVVRLAVDNLGDIIALQQKVLNTMMTDAFLQPLTEEEFLYILNGKGMMIGAYCEEQLIAFRAMLEPEIDEEGHLGIDACVPTNELSTVIYSEISNVDPDFRGNNMQVLLGNIIMREIDTEKFRYVCTTVAPFNIASLKDKFAHGMEIVALKVKYGNLLRYILLKDLTQTLQGENTVSCEVLMADTARQQHYLQSGWRGTAIAQVDDQWVVRFEKNIIE
ncbi:GNAT family N-acetyltransferase [Sporosarcina sp. YIM B06819]|uniref:GNAT family N-acetyltransferase n=1 Tax=Sporosarcina sp. YIM B06819 TaxID=3081769 RepID=UPI00298D4A88|nr:GNAT family N-acetyltransferase [Sporosarcina sp. YIM B06819]